MHDMWHGVKMGNLKRYLFEFIDRVYSEEAQFMPVERSIDAISEKILKKVNNKIDSLKEDNA